jgi:riboflavin synthase
MPILLPNSFMFTGIIETLGILEKITETGGNRSFYIHSAITPELKVDQSLAHNGICLTVEEIDGNIYRVTAIAETLAKTNAGHWQAGQLVNLERAMLMNGRLDGHLVQGHVDAVGICMSEEDQNGSWLYQFSFPPSFAPLVIEKGSITVNGVSLTAFNVTRDSFCVAIIPYTYEHTNLKAVKKDNTVNLEFDMVGKYIQRQIVLNQQTSE